MKSIVLTSSVFVLLCVGRCITALCPPHFVEFPGKCYKYVDGLKNFNQAENNCKALGGFLVESMSQEEFKFVYKQFRLNSAVDGVWVGGKFIAGKWRWVRSNDVITNMHWYPGKPDYCLYLRTKFEHVAVVGDDLCNPASKVSVCQAATLPTTTSRTTTERGSDIEFTSSSTQIQRLNTKEKIRCSVKNKGRGVPEDIANVTSIVISNNGVEIAKVTKDNAASSVEDSSVVDMTGSLNETPEESAFLELKPTDGGNYTCDVTVKDKLGNTSRLFRVLKLEMAVATNSDIVDYILKQKKKLFSNIPDIFFSASFTNTKNNKIQSGQVLVFNKIISALGGGYDKTTGVFTCPVDGFYNFIIHAQTEYSEEVAFHVQHNDVNVFDVSSRDGYAYQDVSNSAILLLEKGDTVKVVSYDNETEVHSSEVSATTTFSGRLIAAR